MGGGKGEACFLLLPRFRECCNNKVAKADGMAVGLVSGLLTVVIHGSLCCGRGSTLL